MTPVSTVSGGTTGTYESYDWSSESYDTNLQLEVSGKSKTAESDESYEGTGGIEIGAHVTHPCVCVRT